MNSKDVVGRLVRPSEDLKSVTRCEDGFQADTFVTDGLIVVSLPGLADHRDGVFDLWVKEIESAARISH
ncbi:hypothetical protein [Halorhabdus sp. CBA1104]|uniref:hypothetical protein n=1 Tax=Halorhabdus sp. CBA1104 TaxID=1380432 RepID=UPI0018A6BFC9|nr:hypothetical protein [Halorhabdus sp. CBA1104]